MPSKLPFSGLLLLALCACSSSPPYPVRMIGSGDAENMSNVVVLEENLRDMIVMVERANVERVPGSNQLKVMVPLRNISSEQIEVLVQVSFLDGRRAPIGDDTNQRLHLIGPGATLPLTLLSKSDAAQDWTMRISWNH